MLIHNDFVKYSLIILSVPRDSFGFFVCEKWHDPSLLDQSELYADNFKGLVAILLLDIENKKTA